MANGRPRTPEPFLRLSGSKYAAVRKDVAPPDGAIVAPEDLDDVARAEWDRVIPWLTEAKVIGPSDRAVLLMYCMNWSRWQQCEAQLRTQTLTVVGAHGGLVANPLIGIARSAKLEMLKAAGEIGLTPVARARLAKPVDKKKPEGKAKLFG